MWDRIKQALVPQNSREGNMESHLSLYQYFYYYDLITLERSLISHSLLVFLQPNPQYGLERVWGFQHLAVHYPD